MGPCGRDQGRQQRRAESLSAMGRQHVEMAQAADVALLLVWVLVQASNGEELACGIKRAKQAFAGPIKTIAPLCVGIAKFGHKAKAFGLAFSQHGPEVEVVQLGDELDVVALGHRIGLVG